MPRVSRAEADSHRQTITDVSARLFKERGLMAVSVSDLMGAAGLTHGGFYGHFESKSALAGLAVEHAFKQSAQRWRQRLCGDADAATKRAALVDAYLAPRSLRDVGNGCPTVALASDVAREPPDAPIRMAYAAGLDALVALLAAVEPAVGQAGDRQAALADYATMVGTLLLARATTGTALSDEFLAAARERLIPSAPAPTAAGLASRGGASPPPPASPSPRATARRKTAHRNSAHRKSAPGA